MSLPIDPRKTRLLNAIHGDHVTQPLNSADDDVAEKPQAPLAIPLRQPLHIKPSNTSVCTTKPPVVIPATVKRPGADIRNRPQQRGSFVLLGALFASVAIFIIATLFVVPLNRDGGQHSQSLAQSVNDWLSRGHVINAAEQIDPPTPTPALRTTEGYCGGNDLWGTCATAVTASGVTGTGQMQRPIRGAVITQVFGHPEYQLWCGCWRPHTGIDLAASYGTPILAADNGQVIWTGWDWSGLGWAVKINHGHYIATVYGHLQRFIVSAGQNITKGQVIGYEGSTGASTGPHLHFMVLFNNFWVNPVDYVQLP